MHYTVTRKHEYDTGVEPPQWGEDYSKALVLRLQHDNLRSSGML